MNKNKVGISFSYKIDPYANINKNPGPGYYLIYKRLLSSFINTNKKTKILSIVKNCIEI